MRDEIELKEQVVSAVGDVELSEGVDTGVDVRDSLAEEESEELEAGDIGKNYLSFGTSFPSTSISTTSTNINPTIRIPERQLEANIPLMEYDFTLPEAALPIPSSPPIIILRSTPSSQQLPTSPSLIATNNNGQQSIRNSDRRDLASIGLLTSPRLIPGSPRTRFDLNPTRNRVGSIGTSPSGFNSGGIPLKPISILNTPQLLPSRLDEIDLGEMIERKRLAEGGEPVGILNSSSRIEDDEMDLDLEIPPLDYIERRLFDGDELNPERTIHPIRTPHPLYTPVINPRIHRRRRRRAMSIHSSRAEKVTLKSITKNNLKSAWNLIRYRKFGKKSSTSNANSSITTGSSSGSSSSSSSSSSSNSSKETWGGWRFWKNSDSGSSSSSSTSDRDSHSGDEWEAPAPNFTLMTPVLVRSSNSGSGSNYPDHLLPSNSIPSTPKRSKGNEVPILLFDDSNRNSTSSGSFSTGKDSQTQSQQPYRQFVTPKPFELSTTVTLAPALERLQSFWLEKRQEDGVAGDLGEGIATAGISHPEVLAGMGRKLRGEEKAAKAERMRLGKDGVNEEGPAWWLDVMCPTVADMREIRKILPLHPLTMEDILQQETREKIESFPSLGYYFVVFRALDESYFRYTSPDLASKEKKNKDGINSTGLKGRVDIIEGVGGKEGVEGVSVGAVNLYLVVFPDGIISFHFEDISKHIERVQGRIHHLSVSRNMSSHWIAYSLMDSIVDAFFPLIDYVEGESNDVATFLADPMNSGKPMIIQKPPAMSDGKKFVNKSALILSKKFKSAVEGGFPKVTVPSSLMRFVPSNWLESTTSSEVEIVTPPNVTSTIYLSSPVEEKSKSVQLRQQDQRISKHDRAAMLKKITNARKLVTGLSRILGPKLDVVKGLRKRMKLEKSFGTTDQDIGIYIGDLSDHIAAMHQSLVFYEAILSRDHPAYLSILRLSLHDAKGGTDIGILRLYVVTLTIIPMNILIGMFSLNVMVPHNGSRFEHIEEDGSLAGFQLFYILLGGIVLVALTMWTIMYLMIQSAKKQHQRKGPATLTRRK